MNMRVARVAVPGLVPGVLRVDRSPRTVLLEAHAFLLSESAPEFLSGDVSIDGLDAMTTAVVTDSDGSVVSVNKFFRNTDSGRTAGPFPGSRALPTSDEWTAGGYRDQLRYNREYEFRFVATDDDGRTSELVLDPTRTGLIPPPSDLTLQGPIDVQKKS